MIDQIVSLAFSMQSNPGVYALLLGSGVSRAAGIPTGWEIILDLIRKFARLKNEDCEPNPAEWYLKKFGKLPNYSELLNIVAKAPAERAKLLQAYFEPTAEEHENNLKIPTEAHASIAELVERGFIRVIITTNFDRLMERALEARGISPTVISTADAVKGALPITHSKCTIIKLHGDYSDTRIKNTTEELESYHRSINKIIDQILDEFGLIICGWSAAWDTALRVCFERCKNHRFTTYWTSKGEPTEEAQKLIKLRKANVITIKEANSFFHELKEKVFALQEFSNPHPLSAKIAVVTLKKYIVNSKDIIRLHDLINSETERLYSELNFENFPLSKPFDGNELVRRVSKYEALSEVLINLFVHGCYWGRAEHKTVFVKSLVRVANPPEYRSGTSYDIWFHLQLYPALLLLYAGGIAAIAHENYEMFASFFLQAKKRNGTKEEPLVFDVNSPSVLDQKPGWHLFNMERRFTPLSDRLYSILRAPLYELLPDEMQYQKIFDKFEYLLALIYVDQYKSDGWGPLGCFKWRYRYDSGIIEEIETEVKAMGDGWPLFKQGLFYGNIGRFEHVQKTFHEFMRSVHW